MSNAMTYSSLMHLFLKSNYEKLPLVLKYDFLNYLKFIKDFDRDLSSISCLKF